MKLALIDVEKDYTDLTVFSYVISRSVIFSEKIIRTRFKVNDTSFLIRFVNHLSVNNLLLYSSDVVRSKKELSEVLAGVEQTGNLNINSINVSLSTRRKNFDLPSSILVSYLLQN